MFVLGMIRDFDVSSVEYNAVQPYPHIVLDDALDPVFARNLQEEIMSTPQDCFDRYANPFEDKYTLRDKVNCSPCLQSLFSYLESPDFVSKLSTLVGVRLYVDGTRNFHGVHVYKDHDKLDIHVDAGVHPSIGLKKHVTVGIYLSLHWKDEYGCQLEIWEGSPVTSGKPVISKCIKSIAPVFNRMVVFTCTDEAWHGNPTETMCPPDARRIFVTVSYLSDCLGEAGFDNKLKKAYFVARPQDPLDPTKDHMRLMRADPVLYKTVYNCKA